MESRKSFLLRMQPELWRELESWAQSEMRSVNGQIEYLLQQAVSKHRRSAAGVEEDAGRQPRSKKTRPGGS